MDLPKRKPIRLEEYDYSQNGAYFVTICTKDRQPILCDIVGTGVPDRPQIKLLNHGVIADKYMRQLNDYYKDICVDKYVIMPDHIHILLSVSNGQSRTPVPTNENINNANSKISKFISTYKRFCNKEYGENIFQRSYYDHIIRGEKDYLEICDYIKNNPIKWYLTHNVN